MPWILEVTMLKNSKDGGTGLVTKSHCFVTQFASISCDPETSPETSPIQKLMFQDYGFGAK